VSEPNHIHRALDAAVVLLDRHGWCQPFKARRDYRDGLCLHEALAGSTAPKPWVGEAIVALSKAVAPQGRGTSIELVTWNDTRGRTRADVDALIARVRKQHA
jgi:hypothetical protein